MKLSFGKCVIETGDVLFKEEGTTLYECTSDKGKPFAVYVYDDQESFDKALLMRKKLKKTGVDIPKEKKVDEKGLAILVTPVEGRNYLDLIYEEPVKDEDIEEIFRLAMFARNGKIGLDYRPHNFVREKKNAVYLSSKILPFSEESRFEKEAIFLYYRGKEGIKYLKEQGKDVSGIHMTGEHETNKEVVLSVVKNYR